MFNFWNQQCFNINMTNIAWTWDYVQAIVKRKLCKSYYYTSPSFFLHKTVSNFGLKVEAIDITQLSIFSLLNAHFSKFQRERFQRLWFLRSFLYTVLAFCFKLQIGQIALNFQSRFPTTLYHINFKNYMIVHNIFLRTAY